MNETSSQSIEDQGVGNEPGNGEEAPKGPSGEGTSSGSEPAAELRLQSCSTPELGSEDTNQGFSRVGTRKGGYLGFAYPRSAEGMSGAVQVYHRYMRQHEPRLEDIRMEHPEEEEVRMGSVSVCTAETRFQALTCVFMLRVFQNAVFSVTVVVSSVVAGLASWGAFELGLATDMPITLYSTAIIFPVSFAINAAYQRRDRVLLDMADLRTNVFELYILARNWTRHQPGLDIHVRMRALLVKTLQYMEQLFTHHGDPKVLFRIYRNLDRMGTLNEELRLVDPNMNGVISRAYQYLRYLRSDFERLRTVFEFRTASEIRSFALIGIMTLGILWSPYFAHLANESTGVWASIYAIVLTNVVLSVLFEIYSGLEDPFDAKGNDDLNFAWVFDANTYLFEDVSIKPYPEQFRPIYPIRKTHRPDIGESLVRFPQ